MRRRGRRRCWRRAGGPRSGSLRPARVALDAKANRPIICFKRSESLKLCLNSSPSLAFQRLRPRETWLARLLGARADRRAVDGGRVGAVILELLLVFEDLPVEFVGER